MDSRSDQSSSVQVIAVSSGAGPCEDVLREIIERISLHKDILRCASVCKQWRSIVMENPYHLPRTFPLIYCLPRVYVLPLLMHFSDDKVVGKVNFLSILDNKSFTDDSVPEMAGKWIAGSSNGCLVLTELLGKKIHIVNPLTRAQISLPSLFDFIYYSPGSDRHKYDELLFIRKALIISEHNSRNLEGCIVVAIVSFARGLSFCRPGDDKWTTIQGCQQRVTDVIYFKGQLYAVLSGGALVSFGVEHQCVKIVAGHAKHLLCKIGKEYLVESTSGDLLLAVRYLNPDLWRMETSTSEFSVYMLEEVDETQIEVHDGQYLVVQTVKYVWVELKSLDDQILFLGRNCKSVPASLYPHLKGNCIYFTDDDAYYKHVGIARAKARHEELGGYNGENYDMGIYDIEERSIHPIGAVDGNFFRRPPIWLEPNLWLKNN